MSKETKTVNNKALTTEELLKTIFKLDDIKKALDTQEADFIYPEFNEYITKLSQEKSESHEKIITRANIERSYGHKLFAGSRKPSRDTVIQLAFGFEADVELAQEMLKVAGKSPLYPRIKRDVVIIYCLYNHTSLEKTQMYLSELNLPLLGSTSKNG